MRNLSKYTFTVFLCLLLHTFAQAQRPRSSGLDRFVENFDNNDRKWDAKKYKKESYAVKDGYYHIVCKKEKGLAYDTKEYYMNPGRPLSIETKVAQTSGDNTNGVGVVWGFASTKNCYRFVVSTDGNFNIGRYKKGKFNHIVKWKKNDAIKQGLNVSNVLKIRGSGRRGLRFYINGTMVHQMSPEEFKKNPFFGNYVGMAAFNQRAAKFDYLKMMRPKLRINNIANAKKQVKKEFLGSAVNSQFNDIAPLISPDGNTLYFIRDDHPQNMKRKKQDIWYANRKPNGSWSAAKNLGRPINNKTHNNIISVSPDNNTLIIDGIYNPDGSNNNKKSGFSIVHRSRSGWKLPKPLVFKNYYNRNDYFGSCMSSDRQKIIFAIEREDTYGDMDLYVCFLQKDGTWSEPKNMGPRINTFGPERAPFLAADGRTLYFSSKGHPGYGSSDIYMTRRLDDTWTRWTTPKNLGPGINTKKSETGFKVTAQGDYAYMVSYNYGNKKNKNDIMRIKLQESARPKPVVMVYGKVLDRSNGKPLGARIAYGDLNTGKLAGIARSNPRDGSYKIVLPYEKAYDFLASKSGFYSVSNHLDLKSASGYKVIKRNLYLAPIKVGAKIRLNNLFFDTGKSDLKPTSYSELNRLVRSLKRYSKMTIEIGGHTDSQGVPGKNLALSKARANAVLNYLSSKGVPKSRLKSKGYGQTKPVAANNNAVGRARNRRVEFTILSK